jgi:uncharacterized protein YraI
MRHDHLLVRLGLILLALALAGVLVAPYAADAQDFGVTVTPNREEIYVRIAPTLGQEVIGALYWGDVVPVTGRTGNRQWYRINYYGQEGWVGAEVVTVMGNPEGLPLGAPAVAPFDLGDGPRAGPSDQVGPAVIRLPESGIRLRGGPSEAYFMIDNVPRYEVVTVTGRSPNAAWLQVNYRGTLGWIANVGSKFIEWQRGDASSVAEWGIVADGPPVNQPDIGPSATRDAIMTAMLLHIDRSLERLDIVSGVWSTIERGGTRVCVVGLGEPQPFIPQERDLNAYPELDPLIAALNEGLEETGRAIELWDQFCDLQTSGLSGSYLAPAAREAIGIARAGYESARSQIFGLGLVPTPTPLPPAMTPAVPVATTTAGASQPDLMAFGLEGNRVLFTQQFTHPELSCTWQGLGGQVLGLNGEALPGYTIRLEGVTDPTLVLTTVSGGETAYGPSGWEIKVADGPNTHVFRVTLFQNDRRVSDPKLVSFPGDCSRNLGLINFTQLTPLE